MALYYENGKIITLTTDFGSKDGYAGAMKGRILSIYPPANIIDISHSISPQSILEGAFCLLRAAPLFPAGTIHVAVVDPTVGSKRKALLIKTKNFYLLGPDNGIFSLTLDAHPPQLIVELFSSSEMWRAHASFDGLELFAPAAAYLAKGAKLKDFGRTIDSYQKTSLPAPFVSDNEVLGEIILFDKFGNAITNIHSSQINKMGEKSISLLLDNNDLKIPLLKYYSQRSPAKSKEYAIINSDGLLELSVFKGSICQNLNLTRGCPVKVVKTF